MRSLFFSLILALAVAAGARADRPVDEHRTVNPDATVSIENVAGSVTVSGWERNEVQVTGTLGDDVEKLELSGDSARLKIKVKLPRGDRSWSDRHYDAELEVHVPRGARVETKLVSASVAVSGTSGAIDLETVSGGVSVQDGGREAEIQTVSGKVDYRGAAEHVTVASVSGGIEVHAAAGDLQASTVSGSVRVEADAAGRTKLESVSGDVAFTGGLKPSSRLMVSSHSGDVELRLPAGVVADFEVSSFSGRIDNDFGPQAERAGRHSRGQELSFSTGSGGPRVSVESFSGAVHLVKQ